AGGGGVVVAVVEVRPATAGWSCGSGEPAVVACDELNRSGD
nr:hypothetical protein [Tanacetum cinerariifolium]